MLSKPLTWPLRVKYIMSLRGIQSPLANVRASLASAPSRAILQHRTVLSRSAACFGCSGTGPHVGVARPERPCDTPSLLGPSPGQSALAREPAAGFFLLLQLAQRPQRQMFVAGLLGLEALM